MSQTDLVADLKASLNDAARTFTAANDADFVRHLRAAAGAFARPRPRTLVGTLALEADRADYPAPAGLVQFKAWQWGNGTASKPWERHWPGPLPRVHRTSATDGTAQLTLDPAPSGHQLVVLGTTARFFYFASHQISDVAGQTTIAADDRELLILRAQVEALRELTMRGVHKPVSLRDGLASTPRNSTPSALYQALLDEFDRRIAA
jgi:hypothetical protein